MSLAEYFCDWKVTGTIKIKTQVPNDTTGHADDTYTGATTIKGVMHTAATNERYFNIEWANDVSKIFKTDDIGILTEDNYLEVNSIRYSVAGINDINEQGLVYVVGLKVHI